MACSHRLAVWHIATAVTLAVSLFTTSASAASPGKLRYSGKVGQTVAYRIEVTADRDNATETLKGVVTYKFTAVDDDAIQVTYEGSLKKSSKAKPSQTSSPFGSRRFGPPRFVGPSRSFGPFANIPFKGLTNTTNELTLSPLGEFKSLKGDSQLPYLLGNASLLIFEPLPEQSKESWTVDSGISITEEGGRRGPPFHIPFGIDQPKRTTAGSEVCTYEVQKVEGSKVTAAKTYRLDSPSPSKTEAGFDIDGNGTWVFDRKLGVSDSLELEQKLVVHKGNTTVSIPMTVKYNRLTDSELAEYQEEQKKKQEEAKQRLAELEEKKANTPLTEEQIKKILENLKSSNAAAVLSSLQTLQSKKTNESDRRLALAVHALRQHKNQFIRQSAEKVAEKLPLPADASAAGGKRTWTDSSGTFSLEAEFLELKDDVVRLRRNDGSELDLPIARLSEADQQVARELATGSKPIENPFL